MDQFLLTITTWLTSASLLAYLACFIWGLISVLMSPCHLASIPLMVGYVGGQLGNTSNKRALTLSLIFSLGLFVAITIVGIAGFMLGTMLGEVDPLWNLAPGLLLLGLAWHMARSSSCATRPSWFGRLQLHGAVGAGFLGLAFGLVSGVCTFAFLAPILAVFSQHPQWMQGVLMLILFALGHCLPIAIAGTSTAFVKQLLAHRSWNASASYIRHFSHLLLAGIGLYFIYLSSIWA